MFFLVTRRAPSCHADEQPSVIVPDIPAELRDRHVLTVLNGLQVIGLSAALASGGSFCGCVVRLRGLLFLYLLVGGIMASVTLCPLLKAFSLLLRESMILYLLKA